MVDRDSFPATLLPELRRFKPHADDHCACNELISGLDDACAGFLEGIALERAQVVAWLKQTANYSPELKRRYHSDDYALAVERGEHRPTDVERRQLFRFGAMKGDKK